MIENIPREARHLLRLAFKRCNCVLLLGPKQVGKTTLARDFAKEYWPNWKLSLDYKDLEQEADRLQLNDIHAFITERVRKLIVLDEAQGMHEIFPKLRTVLDNPDIPYFENMCWLILGSSTSELEALVNQNLVGRHEKIYLTPFSLSELNDVSTRLTPRSIEVHPDYPEQTSRTSGPQKLHKLTQDLWLKGGFPHSFKASGMQASLEWRSQYIDSILGPHLPLRNYVERPDLLLKLWERLAVNQGKCNVEHLSGKLGCNKEIVSKLLYFLESEYLIRKVRLWRSGDSRRLDQNPLWYIRDSGLLHNQLNIKDIHSLKQMDILGKSWEGFVLESILSSAPHSTEVYYFRDDDHHEADFVLELDAGRRWVIEVKFNSKRRVSKGFYKACDAVNSERKFVIHSGPESFRIGKNQLDYFCLYDSIVELKSATRH